MTWICPVCLKEIKYPEYDDTGYNKYRKWNHYMTHTKYELATYRQKLIKWWNPFKSKQNKLWLVESYIEK